MVRSGIVAFAFGTPSSIQSNVRIASMAVQRVRLHSGLVYTQRDVPLDPDIPVVFTPEESGSPPPTLRICRGAVRWARQEKLDELWIAAAGPHLWRCRRDLLRAIDEVGIDLAVRICQESGSNAGSEWYCEDSTQSRTRSVSAWWTRELLLRCLPFWLYQRVAS